MVGFTELDSRSTALGVLSLRRRLEPTLQVDVYEAKLGDEFLMSSLFTASEVELARQGLAELVGFGSELDVVVGGLGLGYTAQATLEDPRVRSLYVVEALPEVIAWHEQDLLPLSAGLRSDARCHLVNGDFFALADRWEQFGRGVPAQCHAVLVDIDHSPRHHLAAGHTGFYEPEGLERLIAHLYPGGVFALWSDDPPDDAFVAAASTVFVSCEVQVVGFPNPHTGTESFSTVYVAKA